MMRIQRWTQSFKELRGAKTDKTSTQMDVIQGLTPAKSGQPTKFLFKHKEKEIASGKTVIKYFMP